jgi:hypothetical protein
MAPEVAKGQYGPEVDVYSLGVMLYEMISGKLPFNGETTAEILMKHLTAQPDLSPIPGALRSTLARALEKDPTQRTPGVRQLEQDFLEALGTIDLKTVPQPTYVPPPVRPGANGHHVDVAGTRNGRPQRPQPFVTKSKQKCRSEKLSPVIRPWKEQFPELTMSLGFAAVVASILSAGIYGAFVHVQHSLHGTGTWHPLFPNIENGVQFAAVSVVGSWLSLIGYAWSVSSEERLRRRWLVRITIGALIGTCAFALHRFLMIETPIAARISRSVVLKIGQFQLSDTTNPFWIGYVCFFAFWMGIRTWSMDMHPNRQDQFTVARTAVAIGMAYVASIVFDFPQLYAMLWAGMISTTVQLSSKWNPKPRTPMEG